ncbi:ECF transporter S component [Lactobacillus sp. LC28-10]|uniref:ECF transporter S component n=1 Tax=Secundilactobacillus angelensis TaxID=2722706 RepID=A0ABX1KZL1_9LACO|nr:ECF transporter S component [Secundilactobacillus angelensis]MCH5461531.1 ECF transporter S component [Secundilactobacillus angelensis]NLR19366.1 ECF transporter S component [Secundilactobacillus angelensis]
METKHHISTREVVYLAMLIAVTVVISRFFLIPVPMTHGNVNLCDAGIFIAAVLLGRTQGAIVGAFSGLLLDLISGYTQYMIFSFIVHGLEGFVAGWLGSKKTKTAKVIAMSVGVLVMVAGYWATDSLLYGFKVGLIGIPTNFIQGIVGGIVAYVVSVPLESRLPRLIG